MSPARHRSTRGRSGPLLGPLSGPRPGPRLRRRHLAVMVAGLALAAAGSASAWTPAPGTGTTPGFATPGSGTPASATARRDTARGTVVLLHGLGRTAGSMAPMEDALAGAGYRVVNLGYPSRRHSVAALSDTLAAALGECCREDAGPVHFVTHSLGGIVVRHFLDTHAFPRLGRVVMLSPPNQGSEVVDRLPDALLRRVLGPASIRLGTDSASVPRTLPPVAFELGVITGEASLNPLFSWWLPGDDDGKVSVESAWVEGTDDFLVVPYTHAFIMRREKVMEQVLAFLRTGAFLPDSPSR